MPDSSPHVHRTFPSRVRMRGRTAGWLRGHGLAALALTLVAVSAPASRAQPDNADGASGLRIEIGRIVDEADLGDRIGIVVHDLRTDRTIFERRGALALNPASNQKLVTAAAALLELGPDFAMSTGLYGRIDDRGRVPLLVIRGQGDPSLMFSDLIETATRAYARGVRRVDEVRVDGSYFDDQFLPPAFEQQPDEAASFRAAVSAVSVERSAFTLAIAPGRDVDARPSVHLEAPGYFALDNSMSTTDGGSPNVIVIQRDREDGRMDLLLRGGVPLQSRGVSYRRRVENPLTYAGYAMVAALRAAGIRAEDQVSVGVEDGLPLIASRTSAPVERLLHRVGKYSDNYVAEMLLKVLGAEQQRPGTSATGTEVLMQVLRRAGANADQISLVNGSGLFDGNQIAAHDLVRVLRLMYRTPSVRSEYLSHLAVGGSDGTLRRRLRNLPAERIVRAKTGTLNDVIGLSGYVLGPEPGTAFAFSVLANGIRGRQGAARQMADRVVQAIAEHLHPSGD